MPNPRGLVPPAIVASAIVLILCSVAWGALGVLSAMPAGAAMSTALHRYLSIALATMTLLSMMVHLTARVVRIIRSTESQTVCGYAEGYTDGVSAAPVSPAVARLTPTRR